MLKLKGKLKRLDGGMPRHEFWDWTAKNAASHGYVFSPSTLRALVARAFRVRPEYEAEVAAYVQMICDATITGAAGDQRTYQGLRCLGLTPIRRYDYGKVALAMETDKGWLVYAGNFRHLDRLLTRRRDQ